MAEHFIDTHAHIYLPEFDADRREVIRSAVSKGVRQILMPNINGASVGQMNRVADEWPGVCHPMMGLHPTSVRENFRDELSLVESELKKSVYAGVGEIGIDLYWDKTFLKEQKEAFRMQIELSVLHDLPVVIHARESFNEILQILDDYKHQPVKGVFHAFTGDVELAERVIRLGFYIGIGGMVTYKKSNLPELIRNTSLSNILLETDSPYLAPTPFRGKRNESSYIPVIAQFIHVVKNIPLDEVAQETTNNALKLFRL